MRVYYRFEWQHELATAARWAPHLGASWQQIGAAVGINADTARRPCNLARRPLPPPDSEWVTGNPGDNCR